jgi:hypothetical protein
MLVLAVAVAGQAAAMSFQWLQSAGVENPTSVAVAGDGTVYVAALQEGQVVMFNHRGALKGRVAVESPVSVAVSSQGVVLVGSTEGDVYVLKEGRFQLFIQEVGLPVAIGFDPGGNIYILDAANSLVRVYTPSGQELFSFGGKGREDGQFWSPLSIAVSSAELYVLDMGNQAEGYKSTVDAPRVQAFGLDGTFRHSWGTYGIADGELLNPLSLCIDEEDRLYVADSAQEVVQVFTGDGAHIATLYDSSHPLATPIEVACRAYKLYVLSLAAERLDVFGVDEQYSILNVEPLELQYQVNECGQVEQGSITISNEGPGTMGWELQASVAWLKPSETSGVLQGGESVTVAIEVEPQGLEPGQHSGDLQVLTEGASETVAADVEVAPPPTLSVEPTSLHFVHKGLGPSDPQSLTVELQSKGELQWNATVSESWLSISPTSGESNTIVLASVVVEPEGLSTGEYEAFILFSHCAGELSVPVSLEYTAGGTVVIRTNLSEAVFELHGPEGTLSGSGTEARFEGLPEGTYTAEFGRVQGFKEPEAQSFMLSAGETVEVWGEYTDLRRRNRIVTAPNAPLSTAIVRVFDPSGQLLQELRLLDRRYKLTKFALGDLDGDGTEEFIVAARPFRAARGQARLYAFLADGTPLQGVDVRVGNHISLATGDLDGDGTAEVLVGTRRGGSFAVRVFAYSEGQLQETLVVNACQGVVDMNVAAADLNGDGPEELVASCLKRNGSVEVSLWRVSDGQAVYAGGFGISKAMRKTRRAVVQAPVVAAGDTNSDAIAEIVLARAYPDAKGRHALEIYTPQGELLRSFTVRSWAEVDVAVADVDFDGNAEIVVGDGLSPRNPARVMIFSADGTKLGHFSAFRRYGVRVALGFAELGDVAP